MQCRGVRPVNDGESFVFVFFYTFQGSARKIEINTETDDVFNVGSTYDVAFTEQP